MDKVYIVIGEYGDYSDRVLWLVASYRWERDALEHVERANAAVAAWSARSHEEREEIGEAVEEVVFELDTVRGLIVATDNQRYRVEGVALLSEVPG